jgi:hypothetical protein
MDNQPNETAAQVKAALPITGDDVRRFIVELRNKLGPKSDIICYTSQHNSEGRWIMSVTGEPTDTCSGKDLDQVMADALAKVKTPEAGEEEVK